MSTSTAVLDRPQLAHKELIDQQLWERLIARIIKDEDLDRETAERILDQTLALLQLSAAEPGRQYSPSPMVDIGWHTFILYTRHYAAFCNTIAGGFIHHEPSDDPTLNYTNGGRRAGPRATARALERNGIAVDHEMWSATATDCTASDGDGDQGCRTGPCNY